MTISEKISTDLNLDLNYVKKIISSSSYYYRDFKIDKKNGGKRNISQPSPELKTFQYWIVYNILNKLPVSDDACAYKKGDSIKKHAIKHCESNYILHSDIKKFFNFISFEHLLPILRENKQIFDCLHIELENSLNEIKGICFRNNSLCIGAVSSPAISNIIMYEFDKTISYYCKNKKYIYTRYADDIYISSKSYMDNSIVDFLENELKRNKFSINKKKTKFYSPKCRKKVTGVIITNNHQISLGRKYRNQIKKMVYCKLIKGEGDYNQIMGYLSFLKNIEPKTYSNIICKYSKYCNGDIIDELKEANKDSLNIKRFLFKQKSL